MAFKDGGITIAGCGAVTVDGSSLLGYDEEYLSFYRKTGVDNAAGKGSLSLLVPGNVLQSGTSYYDADGRRLLHAVAP